MRHLQVQHYGLLLNSTAGYHYGGQTDALRSGCVKHREPGGFCPLCETKHRATDATQLNQ